MRIAPSTIAASTKHRVALAPDPQSLLATPPHPFNCVLIYEDSAAGQLAESFYLKLVDSIDHGCDTQRLLWSFDVLGVTEMRNLAASAAASADLVVFAASGRKHLPSDVTGWIEMWLWLIDRGHPALVPLFDRHTRETHSIASYLKSVAALKHLDCFPHFASSPTPDCNAIAA